MYKTLSGKDPNNIKVRISLHGNTYPYKEQLKRAGWKYNYGAGFWIKSCSLRDTVDIVKEYIKRGIIDTEWEEGRFVVMGTNSKDTKDVQTFNKRYLEPLCGW